MQRTPNRIMRWFECGHLPPDLRAVSEPIQQLAEDLDQKLEGGSEKQAGLRKLLEAKDCFVRAAISDRNGES